MASILCLAHYCDTHGPTPLMVTEGRMVECDSCSEDDMKIRRPSTSSQSRQDSEGIIGDSRNTGRVNISFSDKENGELQRSQSMRSPPPLPIETPPGSPRVKALQSAQNANSHRRDSSFRKTYDENDKKRAIPCENCALTLPKKTKVDSPGGGGSGKIDNNGPILRTRKPYERVTKAQEPSPPKSSTSSESGDSDTAVASRPCQTSLSRANTSSSDSSSTSSHTHTHKHFLDYTSTHEPLDPTSFSLIRQSCLRTLSCETLPPTTTPSSVPSSPLSSNATSGGPIFFGDPLAGYTTAFIFRIPDPNARGRRRVYALMALSTHRERLAMQTFSLLSSAFRDLAAWIQGLAEAEMEREGGSPRVISSNTSTSSFLSGRFRGAGEISLKSRGLAELVGLPDFFIELHAKFVRLLIELGLLLGT